MEWFFLAVLTAAMMGAATVINRFALRRDGDHLAFALAFHFFAVLFFIPLFAIEWAFPSAPEAWLLALVASVLWAAVGIVGFQAYRYAEVTLKTPVGRSKVLWVLLFSALLLGEAVTAAKVAGILLVFVGVMIVAFKPRLKHGGFGDLGVKLTLLSAFIAGMVYVVDKAAMAYFQPGLYGFLQYLLPMLWIGLVVPKPVQRAKKLLLAKGTGWLVAASAFLAAAWTWMLFRTYQLADVSAVAPVLELSVVVAAGGGILFLGERKDVKRRLLGAVLVVAGALLMK
ncbi:MAG: DMT family transporter [Candidatus Micrarchaeota archaeon]|nr:DMT family transporter [Candidatus Micrarchaeota archaeon]